MDIKFQTEKTFRDFVEYDGYCPVCGSFMDIIDHDMTLQCFKDGYTIKSIKKDHISDYY